MGQTLDIVFMGKSLKLATSCHISNLILDSLYFIKITYRNLHF